MTQLTTVDSSACSAEPCRPRRISTENSDGIPITTLHLSRFLKRVTRKQVLSSFRLYGKIVNSYFKYQLNQSILYCFITYSNANEALIARTNCTKLYGVPVKVLIADPWHQKSGRTTTIKRETGYHVKDDNIVNILNEDCFRHILSYLPLHELIRSERVSKKWQSLVKMQLQSHRVFKASTWRCEELPLQTHVLHAILKKIGNNLKILHLDQDWSTLEQRAPYLISKFCPNLTELLVNSLRSKNWYQILLHCTNLKSMTFNACCDINDNTFKYSKAELNELSIIDSQNTLGKFLSYIKLNALKRLHLINLTVNEHQLTKSFVHLGNLSHLCLDNVNLSFTKINDILKYLPKLTHLVMRNMMFNRSNILSLTEHHDLQHLHLSSNTYLNNQLIRNICKSCPKLNTFEITPLREGYESFSCLEDINDTTMRCIFSLKELERLNLSGLIFGDGSFSTLSTIQNQSKVKEISLRGNKLITKVAIFNIFAFCPNIQKVDVCNTLFIYPSIVEKLIDIIHMRECKQNRCSLITTWSDVSPKSICKCLNIKLELFNDIFLVGVYSDEDIDNDDDFDDEDDFDDVAHSCGFFLSESSSSGSTHGYYD